MTDDQLKDVLANSNMEFLLKHRNAYNIDHRFPDEDNNTLLLSALSDRGSSIYRFLLEYGADIYAINNNGENALHCIIFSRDLERLHLFTEQYPEATSTMINRQSSDGTTPLLLAAMLNDLPMVNHLLNQGAEANTIDYENNTPLHAACYFGNMEMVRLLIEHKANVHIKTGNGNYPLMLAINEDHEAVARYLFSLFYAKNDNVDNQGGCRDENR